jgi:ML domain
MGSAGRIFFILLIIMLAIITSCLAIVASAHRFRNSRTVNESKALIVIPPVVGAAQACSDNSALAKNFVVTIDNDAPKQGEKVTTTFDFDLDAPITGGTAYYSATLNGLGPFASNAPLCDETAKTGDPCPLAVGHHHEVSTAENTVSGKVVTTITWEDPENVLILCAQITTKSS